MISLETLNCIINQERGKVSKELIELFFKHIIKNHFTLFITLLTHTKPKTIAYTSKVKQTFFILFLANYQDHFKRCAQIF